MTIPLVYLAEGGLFIQHIITHFQLYTPLIPHYFNVYPPEMYNS